MITSEVLESSPKPQKSSLTHVPTEDARDINASVRCRDAIQLRGRKVAKKHRGTKFKHYFLSSDEDEEAEEAGGKKNFHPNSIQ